MSYVTSSEVYAACSLTSSEVDSSAVDAFIDGAEKRADRVTMTTYWSVQSSGTATAGTVTTLTDSGQTWTVDAYANMYVWIHSGTGSGQVRLVSSNTSTEITVSSNWDTTPDTTSQYRVIYCASDPNISDSIDGTGTRVLYTTRYPVRILESLSIDSTSVTPANVFIYDKLGKLQLGDDAEVTYFTASKPQQVAISYWYGVYPMPADVKRYVIVCAAMSTLEAQMGGTHNVPSTYSLPEGSVTIGQAYVNIRGTYDVLAKEKAEIEKYLPKYMLWE